MELGWLLLKIPHMQLQLVHGDLLFPCPHFQLEFLLIALWLSSELVSGLAHVHCALCTARCPHIRQLCHLRSHTTMIGCKSSCVSHVSLHVSGRATLSNTSRQCDKGTIHLSRYSS